MLPLLILVPLAGLILLNLPGNVLRRLSLGFALVVSLLQIEMAIAAPPEVWPALHGIEQFFHFTLLADSLTRVLLLSVGIVVFITLLAMQATVSSKSQRFNLVNVVLISLIGMNGAVLVRDLFSLYVFLEVTSVASFVLIASGRDENGLEGAFKYLVLSAVATVLMLSGVALFMMFAGGTGFDAVASAIRAGDGGLLLKVAMAVFLCGLFIKGGLVPFHGWLPDAYSAAPAAVSVLLAGIVTKASGIYALIRLSTSVFKDGHVNQVLLLAGAVSMLVGALAALKQSNMKRLLAYSSISQVGYIILGLGCGTELGILGAVFHLFNHSIFKSLLFVNSSAVEQRAGTTDMNQVSGLGGRMPVTGVTSVIATLSTAGVPPMAGFWSKLIIVIALWKAGYFAYAAIAILVSVLTLGYLLTMQRRVFFGKELEEFSGVREASGGLVLAEVILAAITVGTGVLFPYVLDTFILPLRGIL